MTDCVQYLEYKAYEYSKALWKKSADFGKKTEG